MCMCMVNITNLFKYVYPLMYIFNKKKYINLMIFDNNVNVMYTDFAYKIKNIYDDDDYKNNGYILFEKIIKKFNNKYGSILSSLLC
jgi:hypothetical protein